MSHLEPPCPSPVRREHLSCTGAKGRGKAPLLSEGHPSGLRQTSDRCVLLPTLSLWHQVLSCPKNVMYYHFQECLFGRGLYTQSQWCSVFVVVLITRMLHPCDQAHSYAQSLLPSLVCSFIPHLRWEGLPLHYLRSTCDFPSLLPGNSSPGLQGPK